MIISATLIENPRASRTCDMCLRSIIGRCVSLYGAAETSDPPYRIWVHESCMGPDAREFIARKETTTTTKATP